MTDNNETVAVPVELLRALSDAVNGHLNPELKGRATALLPKPKPRIVVVTEDQWDEGLDGPTWFEDQPDLLTLLDGVADMFDNANLIKDANRSALGVTE